MLKYKLSVFILGLPMLNCYTCYSCYKYCSLTFKVINGKVSREGFDTGCLPATNIWTNSIPVSLYHIL